MKIKISSRKTAIGIGLFILEIVLALGLLFIILALILGVYLILSNGLILSPLSIVAFISTVLLSLFLAALDGLLLLIVHRKGNQYLPPKPISKNGMRQIFYLVFGLNGTLFLYIGITNYLNVFPKNISSPLMLQILGVVIQTNGFLIALSGIVFAQMFWAIHNQMCGVQNNIFDTDIDSKKQTLEGYLWKLDRTVFNFGFS